MSKYVMNNSVAFSDISYCKNSRVLIFWYNKEKFTLFFHSSYTFHASFKRNKQNTPIPDLYSNIFLLKIVSMFFIYYKYTTMRKVKKTKKKKFFFPVKTLSLFTTCTFFFFTAKSEENFWPNLQESHL